MSDWAELQLSDICNLISSKTSMTNASLGNYVSTENMMPNFGGLVKAEKLPSGTMVNAFLTEDVLFSNIRTYFKKVWSAQFEGTVSADVLVFRAKQICDPKFLYYTLCEPDFTEYTVLTSRGAKMPRGDKEAILSYKLGLPPLPEQKAIASVLSSLDDKIDLLHRQNKTLEAMAETLFRQWFIEEAKEDWKVSSLGEVVKIAYGKNLPTSRLLDSGYPVFGGNGQIGFYDRFLYSEPQVLVSCRGEASGKVNISLPNSFITNNSLVLERKENGISFEYLKFYALAYDFGLHVSGSAQPQITIDGLFNAEFRWPPLGLVESFTEVVRPLEDKRLTNYIQIQTLENLRDTLLPKLMSGEVRVQYQTEEVA